MAERDIELKFEDIKFHETDVGVRGVFLKNFYFDIESRELDKMGKWHVKDGSLLIKGNEDLIRKRFNFLLNGKLAQLQSLNGKRATYIYEGLCPLIGSLYFGIIDRDTNVIEVRPITGCNQNCIFCSVDLDCRKRDFVVSVDYLLKEFERVAAIKLEKLKSGEQIEAHINAQGEPLLYSKLPELIKGLHDTEGVGTISIDTNAILLTEKKVDELVAAGLTRFNISIESLSAETASKIAGVAYPLSHIKKICEYIATKSQILLAPVWLHGINDDDIEEIVKFGLELEKIQSKNGIVQKAPHLGIQNFLSYDSGKNPVKEQSWYKFYQFLEKLEKKYDIRLKLKREDFGIVKCKSLEKPFRKDDVVEARLLCPGMMPDEFLAVSEEDKSRIIVIPDSREKRIEKKIKVKLTRDKYNVFYAKVA